MASLSTLGLVVAKCYNLYTGNVGPTLYGTRATHTEAYKAYTYGLNFGSGKVDHVLLTGRALGSVNNNSTFFPMPLG